MVFIGEDQLAVDYGYAVLERGDTFPELVGGSRLPELRERRVTDDAGDLIESDAPVVRISLIVHDDELTEVVGAVRAADFGRSPNRRQSFGIALKITVRIKWERGGSVEANSKIQFTKFHCHDSIPPSLSHCEMPFVGFVASGGIVFVIDVIGFSVISVGAVDGDVGERAERFGVQSIDVFN